VNSVPAAKPSVLRTMKPSLLASVGGVRVDAEPGVHQPLVRLRRRLTPVITTTTSGSSHHAGR
jgi:hypothetical protein